GAVLRRTARLVHLRRGPAGRPMGDAGQPGRRRGHLLPAGPGVPAAHLAVERARADAAPGLRRHRSGDGAGTRAAPRRPDAGRHAEDVPRLRRPGGPSVLPVLRLDGERSGIAGAAGESPATPRHRRVWPPAAQGNPVPSTVLAVVLAPAARV